MPPDGPVSPQPSIRILYADDMEALREVARLMLLREGHAVECVADGQEAIDRVTADPGGFDLLMTDHHMPRMNGLELVTRLREMQFPGKILVFSSELGPGTHDAYLRLGVHGVLYKPVLPEQLRQALATLFPVTAPP